MRKIITILTYEESQNMIGMALEHEADRKRRTAHYHSREHFPKFIENPKQFSFVAEMLIFLRDDERDCEYIASMRKLFPNSRIVAAIMANSPAVIEAAFNKGADDYILLPATPQEIMYRILNPSDPPPITQMDFIIFTLKKNGFNTKPNESFKMLCRAIQIVMDNPLAVKSMFLSVYDPIAEEFNSNRSCVERLIRFASKDAKTANRLFVFSPDKVNVSFANRELLVALANATRKEMNAASENVPVTDLS